MNLWRGLGEMRQPAGERKLHLKLRLAVFLIFSYAASASAQISNPGGSLNERANVSGTVVNSETGEPVPRALVQLGPMMTLSDDKGNFSFNGVPTMQTSLYAEKPGYFNPTQLQGNFRQFDSINVAPGIGPQTVKLLPEGIIFGQVASSDGEPLEFIPISIASSSVINGIRMWQQRGATQTDDEGRYRIAELPPGIYYLSAGPSRSAAGLAAGANATVSKEDGYSKVFYPAGQDFESASPIAISAGKHVDADFTLPEQEMYRVSGIVRGFAPSQRPTVAITNDQGSIAAGAIVNPQTGVFSSGYLTPGTYIVRAAANPSAAMAPIDDPNLLIGRATVQLNSDLRDVQILLAPPRKIPIEFTVDWASQPPANENFRPAIVQLYPEHQAFGTRQSISPTISPQPSHQESFVDVAPGRYLVELRANGPIYVASAMYGDSDLLRENLVLTEEPSTQPIKIYLRDDGGSLEVHVNFPGEKSRAVVFAVPEATPRLVQMSMADPNGVARFRALAPGAYKVFAIDNAEGLEYKRPEGLQDYLAGASEISVEAKGHASVAVPVVHREN